MHGGGQQRDLFTKRARKAPPAREFSLHVMVADVLRRWAAAGWQWTHFPAGEYRLPATAARLKRMGVRTGWPDFMLLSTIGAPHFLELKRRGGTLNEAQEDFAGWCIARGVPFACVDSFNEALAVLREWGAVRASIAAA
jgi:hypothetical protein